MGKHSAPKQASKVEQALDRVSLYKGLAFALPAGVAVAGLAAPGVAHAAATDAHTLVVKDPVPQTETVTLTAFKLKVHHKDKVAIVERGDTLSGIAQEDCHQASKWPALYRASRKRGWLGPDPDLIYSGDRVDLACKSPVEPAVSDATPKLKPVIRQAVIAPTPVKHKHHKKHLVETHISGIVGTVGNGMLPANYNTIYNYLRSRGLSKDAAAGVLGNIRQESDGNPFSVGDGGCGLIGWTPCSVPVGNLGAQMADVVKYIEVNGSIGNLNSHSSSPAAAAEYFMAEYERCNPVFCAAGTREEAADAVAHAEGF